MCLVNEFALSVVQNVGSARRYCFVTIEPKYVDQIARWRHLESWHKSNPVKVFTFISTAQF